MPSLLSGNGIKMKKKVAKMSPDKIKKLRAKREAEKQSRLTAEKKKHSTKKLEVKKAKPVEAAEPIVMDFSNLKVNGHKLGDPLPVVDPVVEDVVVKMFWDDEPPPLVNQPGLFKVTNTDELGPDWKGWTKVHYVTQHFYFNDFGYFKGKLEEGQFSDLEDALAFAQKVLNKVSDIHQGAVTGDPFDNSLMRLFGMEAKHLQHVHGMSFYKMMQLAWNVGHAESVKKTKAALNKKAEDGDLEAQKTILKQEGVLSVENAPSGGGGDIVFTIDAEDMKA